MLVKVFLTWWLVSKVLMLTFSFLLLTRHWILIWKEQSLVSHASILWVCIYFLFHLYSVLICGGEMISDIFRSFNICRSPVQVSDLFLVLKKFKYKV
ncbi:hypothetical protein F3Y22_tig00002237pilonHSYRG01979 [Hibiscus syriacus]|uniref:Uncharacterized protein n=1 Tax=Hibiscus syriacus TaxID=106335 RepID=A0A6A3CYC5_HIBSY|nr:hypothetical protein F3Y22_tig00002237pilonHSYRG01979 [Hibiscus syriacus]